jgi:hypothetical protein
VLRLAVFASRRLTEVELREGVESTSSVAELSLDRPDEVGAERLEVRNV